MTEDKHCVRNNCVRDNGRVDNCPSQKLFSNYACDVTLSVYPHRASLKNMPDYGGNRTYDLWNTSQEHWASIPKVVGSIPTVVRHIFQVCPVWIYNQSNITSIIFT
jgi:hypothetical protein